MRQGGITKLLRYVSIAVITVDSIAVLGILINEKFGGNKIKKQNTHELVKEMIANLKSLSSVVPSSFPQEFIIGIDSVKSIYDTLYLKNPEGGYSAVKS